MVKRYYLLEVVALPYLILLHHKSYYSEGFGGTPVSSLVSRRVQRTDSEVTSTAISKKKEVSPSLFLTTQMVSSRSISTTRLLLSSIPEDDKKRETPKEKEGQADNNALEVFITKNLPPAPENFLVLGGDVAALFTYSFLDHSLNQMSSAILAKEAAEGIVGIHAVWIDAMPPAFLLATQQAAAASASSGSAMITYAPAFHHAGICSVLFASCWLLSGYFHRAFSYDNTIFCSPVRAVLLAGRTWIFTAVAMLTIAFLSDIFASDLQYQVGGITRADADYIFDSLAVIVSWRFMIATILGRY